MIKVLFLFLLVYIIYRAFTFFLKIGIFKLGNFNSKSNDSIGVDKTNFKKKRRSKDLGEFVDYEDLE